MEFNAKWMQVYIYYIYIAFSVRVNDYLTTYEDVSVRGRIVSIGVLSTERKNNL